MSMLHLPSKTIGACRCCQLFMRLQTSAVKHPQPKGDVAKVVLAKRLLPWESPESRSFSIEAFVHGLGRERLKVNIHK